MGQDIALKSTEINIIDGLLTVTVIHVLHRHSEKDEALILKVITGDRTFGSWRRFVSEARGFGSNCLFGFPS